MFSARTISRRLRDGLGIRALTRPSLRRRSWIGGRAFSTMCGSAVQPSPKVGLMKLQPAPGEHRYAVAVREGSDLWLALWIRRSRKGEFFIMVPRGDRDWDVHTSYHLDGTLHMKSHGRKVLPPTKRQPLTGMFRGTEPLGAFFGYGPKSVGAICDPAAFSGGVVEVGPCVLRPGDGGVDLVEPGCDPATFPWTNIARREVIRDIPPWVVITIGSCG